MNANEIIAKLRDKFNELMQPVAPVEPVEPAKPKAAKLIDGTEVEISEYAPGGVVTIAGAPAPAGDHTLEDGTTITLAEGGVITEIEAPEAAPAAPDMTEEMKKKMDEMQTQFNAYVKENNAKVEAISKTSDAYKALFSEMFTVVEAIAKAPVAQPDAAVQTEFKDQAKPDYSKLANQFITKK